MTRTTGERLRSVSRIMGRAGWAFLILLIVDLALTILAPRPALSLLLRFFELVLGGVLLFQLLQWGIRKAIWRLRNRLIVAYLFIAVVPVLLILILVGLGAYTLMGQVAIYLVSSELERRTSALMRPAENLLRADAEQRPEALRRLAPFIRNRFPELQIHIRDSKELRYPEASDITAPPKGWGNTSGVMVKQKRLYGWAHAISGNREVTLLAPLTRDFLAELHPNLGDVFFLESPASGGGSTPAARKGRALTIEQIGEQRRDRVPPPLFRLDIALDWISPITVDSWSSPGSTNSAVLIVRSRPSAVLGTVFGQKVEWAQGVMVLAIAVLALFLIVELISLVIGVSITRTITQAVHDLYEGTQRVKEGDFAHRIPVSGGDQLAELGHSFNRMTENLQNLIVVAKEKERMQSELEIAREVQNQLFPKAAPSVANMELAGVCHPARMVSGDYYDFLCMQDSCVAMAIGDVAGKGISAALLMASIQSIMRTQLSSVVSELAQSRGIAHHAFCTSQMVALLNKQLFASTSPEKFATFYFGVYDPPTATLRYTNAGHLPPILVRDGSPQLLEVTGMVVGAFPFSTYEEKSVELRAGDLLVAYTDGIVEPEDVYGEMFGEERLIDLLLTHKERAIEEIIARVMEAVRQWTGTPELQDDMTMLVMRRI